MSRRLSLAQANFKADLWNAEAESTTSSDFYRWLQDMGLPEEIVTRLHDLIGKTMKVGKKIIAIGKVLLLKIIEFVKAHPFLVVGFGIGAVVGAAVYSMIISVPAFGPHLEPVARALGIGISVFGAVEGHKLDKLFPEFGQNLVEVASAFFSLLTSVFNMVFGNAASA